MARTLVKRREGEGGEVPFLRGILTRSLQACGVSFQAAYQIATSVRDELKEVERITPDELREHVLRHLQGIGGDVARRYRARRSSAPTILVRFPEGQAEPFSRGRQRLEMGRCGLSPAEATRAAESLYAKLVQLGVTEIDHRNLLQRTCEHLAGTVGSEAAHRYVVWDEFHRSGRPLIVLLGGTAGTGKSTLSAQLAHELEIVRTQSTDMLREVMRMMVPERLVPVLHTSSYTAWEAIPYRGPEPGDVDQRIVEGYLSQCELLSVACEAVLQRAVAERVSLILEGVHVLPSLSEVLPADSDAIVVPAVVGVLDPEELRRRIRGRSRKAPGRRAKRYLKHFDEIWCLQSFLLSEADRNELPIVANDQVDRAVHELTGIVLDHLSRHFRGTLEPG